MRWIISAVALAVLPSLLPAEPLKVLFLGDRRGHQSETRFRLLQPALAPRGISLVYTEAGDALHADNLAKYDGLIVYANIDDISPEHEKALLDYVANGKGFIPLHCASYCFRNSPKVVELIGAQFLRHGTGTFRTTIVDKDHPVMKGFRGFESWDETYVHTKHNEKDRTVLEKREGEPWTWVRTHGKGRVFYTAWGHDERTFGHPGFHNLVERGIRWACGQDPSVVPGYADRPEMTALRKDVKPFEYVEAKVPFYSPRGGAGVPLNRMQKPLSTEESIKHFVHPTDFEVKLFVDETKLGGKPLCMNWDHRGRLWVALTADYPNELKRDGEGRDRIVICEDTDGDWVCDKVTLFADKLSIPTSILPLNGGVLVHQAPYTLFLKDTNGDGVADKRETWLTGWGTGDTHAGPSNLRLGLDNWIYGIVGYSAFRGRVGEERFDFRQGFYRFKPLPEPGDALLPDDKPRTGPYMTLEFLRSTSNNSWGVGISEEGLLFGSTANGCPTVFMPIANRYYEKVRGVSPTVLRNIAPDNHFEPITSKVRQVDWHGGFTAAAGHALYTARNYPGEYWNRIAFVCEPTGHLVAMFELIPDGANFKARYFGNLLASDDEWCAPIAAEVGPDGNVWVLDWYNFIVQHNPTPPGFVNGRGNAYETDLRDKKHGRIYRVVPKGEKPAAVLSLEKATAQQLVDTLKHPNMFWRLQAQSKLVDRLTDAQVPLLVTMMQDAKTPDVGIVHALWTLDGRSKRARHHFDDEQMTAAVTPLLKHPSAAVRKAAIEVLPRNDKSASAIEKNILEDSHPQVRLAVMLALTEVPTSSQAGEKVGTFLMQQGNFSDPVLLDALTMAASAHARYTLVRATELNLAGTPGQRQLLESTAREFALKGKDDGLSDILVRLDHVAPAPVREAILAGLASWKSSAAVKLTPEAEGAVKAMLFKLPASGRGRVLRLAGMWGVKGMDEQLAEVHKTLMASLGDAKADESARIDAARQLIELKPEDDEAVKKVLAAITPQAAPTLVGGLFEALAASRAKGIGAELTKRVTGMPPASRTAALRVLLSRSEWVKAFLEAAEKGQVALDVLALDQRVALSAHSDRTIADRAKKLLARGGGLPDPDRAKVIEQFANLTKKTGDADAGKVIFKNNCAKCHRHTGEGEAIGPDLTGTAVHTKEHILTDILDPSRNVEGNFRIYRVEMNSGRGYSGLLASETKTTIELIDAEAKRHVLQRSEIEELAASTKSLMPEGFEKTLKPDDLANLLEFLTKKGKYLPLPLDKAATVVSTKGMFYSEESTLERLVFSDWSPKTFNSVPFNLVDPRGDKSPNVIMLYGPTGKLPPTMPRSVKVPCNTAAKAVHFLSGVGGWCFPATPKGTTSMIVRLHYADGKTEDHALKNGEHFADYIRREEVPGSTFAFRLRGQQVRYLAVTPEREAAIAEIELVKGTDSTAPVVMAITVETR